MHRLAVGVAVTRPLDLNPPPASSGHTSQRVRFELPLLNTSGTIHGRNAGCKGFCKNFFRRKPVPGWAWWSDNIERFPGFVVGPADGVVGFAAGWWVSLRSTHPTTGTAAPGCACGTAAPGCASGKPPVPPIARVLVGFAALNPPYGYHFSAYASWQQAPVPVCAPQPHPIQNRSRQSLSIQNRSRQSLCVRSWSRRTHCVQSRSRLPHSVQSRSRPAGGSAHGAARPGRSAPAAAHPRAGRVAPARPCGSGSPP